jgi:hypothetical protein
MSVHQTAYPIFGTTESISSIFNIRTLYSQLNNAGYIVLVCIGPVQPLFYTKLKPNSVIFSEEARCCEYRFTIYD